MRDSTHDGVLQSRLGRADDREADHVDDVAGRERDGLVGLDQRRAGRVPYVNPVTHLLGPRVHRDVFDERRLPDACSGHRPTHSHPTVDLVLRVMGIQAGDRAHRKRPGIGRRRVDDGVGGASCEERNPANLPRLVVQRAGVATKPDAGVDEAGQVLAGEIPEPGAHRAAIDSDVDEECFSGLGQPGPLTNADDLDVFTIEHAADQRRIWHSFRGGKHRPADPAHGFGNDVGSETFSRGIAVDFDHVAGLQVEPRILENVPAAVSDEQTGAAVVHDEAGRLALVDVGHGAANEYALALLGDLRRQLTNRTDGRERRRPVLFAPLDASAHASGGAVRQAHRSHEHEPRRSKALGASA